MFFKLGNLLDDEFLSQRLLSDDNHISPPPVTILNVMVNRTQLALKEFKSSSATATIAFKYEAPAVTTSPQPHAEQTPSSTRLTTFPGCPRGVSSSSDEITVTREPESTSTLISEAAEVRGNAKRPVICCVRATRRVHRRTNIIPEQHPKAKSLVWNS